ncbi:MAG: ABC transporter ATP-binding protein [Gammaproteobacteria bacterium]|nr:ABC transporter ATP-binding protein [Gammaproteobacteria bacterium]CAJ2375821.1 MAG: ABC transporter [Arenicellales bacterium IbO2]MDA7961879.1 ABC transporter ATP-binding protein [Gammaproteobacteria bacterium]MDA7970288.1 ABC transporter ATP-binding protein [Gammaproteobacteria bacterium]MDA7995712.1 ABC transporter ATP-binding protein [Gammaproteobacteria bacterium]
MPTKNSSPPPLLELRGMTKTFPGVVANREVGLSLRAGEIHALLGENGAGKSTLVKMIYGVLKADSGEMRWMGAPADIRDPARARALGIAMVFQHFSLFDSLSVLENIALGMPADTDRDRLKTRIHELSDRYGLPLDADRHVYTLSVGERQRVEIIRCLLQEPKLLVMDEPTSVLTPQEVAGLFETLKQLAEEGLAVLYISHKLDEIKALCKRATILRGGSVVGSVSVARESAASLAAKMIGEELKEARLRGDGKKRGPVRLEVARLDMPAADEFSIALRDIRLSVRGGEILGIAGVAGNGQDELLAALCGEARAARNNRIRIDGHPCARAGPNRRRALGLASIPGERLGHGAVPEMSLLENGLLTSYRRLGFVKRGFIRRRECRAFVARILKRFRVKAAGDGAVAASLSGGNLQKFIVGREICQSPALLVVSQPTWGVDAGAAQTIRLALRKMADKGAAIVVISQDLDELMSLSDNIAAICAGALSQPVPTDSVTVERIGLLMAGARDAN